MLYPNRIKAKKSKKIVKILLVISAILAVLLVAINKITTPNIYWSGLCIAGIVYTWITVIYAMNKNVNIATHVLVQTVAVSLFLLIIDILFKFSKWSINLGIPIVLIIANVTMLVLTIISHRKYIRYTICQLSLCIISIIPLVLLYNHITQQRTLVYISSVISLLNFVVTILLCRKDLKEELKRRFNM